MSRTRRHALTQRTRVRGSARVAVSIALGVLLLGGGAAYATYRYDAATGDRLLPGVTLAGVEVGEMSRQEAVAAVSQRADAELGREILVEAGGEVWHVTPAELGTTAGAEALVDEALDRNQDYSWPERVLRRVLNRPIGHVADVRLRPDIGRLRPFVEGVAEAVFVDPTNASVEYVDGELVLGRPKAGRSLSIPEAKRALKEAVTGGAPRVQFDLDRVEPEVTKADLGHTIVVDLSELDLYLYDGLRKVKTYPVAAGQSSYPTPQGEWTIVDKVEYPSWTNPDPEGWGASLPLHIPPGPSNPLGTRALYLDAPGVRIHGTSASYSIGTYASHGCVRMYMEDVEELFEIVPTGTTVHIVP